MGSLPQLDLNNKFGHTNYYSTNQKKVADLFIGIGAAIGGLLLIFGVLPIPVSIIVAILIYIISLIIFFVTGRHYVAIGLLVILAIPLFVFGSCLVLFNGLKL